MAKFNFAAFLVALSLGEMVLIILADMYGVFVVLVGWLGVGGVHFPISPPNRHRRFIVVVFVVSRRRRRPESLNHRLPGECHIFFSWKTMEPETI
jgi:hypothetical protein